MVVFIWKKSPNNSIFVDDVFDIGTRQSDMQSKVEVAEFWRRNKVNFDNVEADVAEGFKVRPLPRELHDPLPRQWPRDLGTHYKVNFDRDLVYHGYDPLPLEESLQESLEESLEEPLPKMPKVHLELNEDYQLELNLFKMLLVLDKLKGEDFSPE